MNICWKKSDAECLMVNMLLFDNCCWIKVRSLDRPFGFLASPAHFLFLSLYQERYLERNKRKQVLSLHNLHNRCRYQIVVPTKNKYFSSQGNSGVCTSSSRVDGPDPRGSAYFHSVFKVGPQQGAVQPSRKSDPDQSQLRHQLIWWWSAQGRGRLEKKKRKCG